MTKSRSERIRRGFIRLAVVGLVPAVLASAYNLLQWALPDDGILTVNAASQWVVVDDGDPQQVSQSLVSLVGQPSYAEKLLNPWTENDKYPFESSIMSAKRGKIGVRETHLELSGLALAAGMTWAAMALILSWLIRGFMAD